MSRKRTRPTFEASFRLYHKDVQLADILVRLVQSGHVESIPALIRRSLLLYLQNVGMITSDGQIDKAAYNSLVAATDKPLKMTKLF